MALTTNLVSYWKLDGNSTDAVGSNSGTDTSISYGNSFGIINNGGSFNGTSSKIEKTSASGLGLGTGAFSISLWMNLQGAGSASSNGKLLAMDNAGSTPRIFIDATTGTNGIQAQFYDGTNGANAQFTPTTATWYHIVFLRDASSHAKLYINGSLQSTDSATFGTPASCNISTITEIKLGSSYGGTVGFYNGYMDEVGIWSRELTTGEITSLYNSGAGFQYPFVPFIASSRNFQASQAVRRAAFY